MRLFGTQPEQLLTISVTINQPGSITGKNVGTPGTIGYKYQQIKELRAIRVKLCRAVVVETEKQKIEKIRVSVEPLLKQLKRLTPEQREKATELMFMADSLETENTNRQKEKQELLDSMPDRYEVHLTVLSQILPNTEIRIADRYTTIKEKIKGPVKILLRKIEGVTEMVLVSQSSGAVHTLKSRKLDISHIELPQKPEIAQPGTENKDITEGAPDATKCSTGTPQSSK